MCKEMRCRLYIHHARTRTFARPEESLSAAPRTSYVRMHVLVRTESRGLVRRVHWCRLWRRAGHFNPHWPHPLQRVRHIFTNKLRWRQCGHARDDFHHHSLRVIGQLVSVLLSVPHELANAPK